MQTAREKLKSRYRKLYLRWKYRTQMSLWSIAIKTDIKRPAKGIQIHESHASVSAILKWTIEKSYGRYIQADLTINVLKHRYLHV